MHKLAMTLASLTLVVGLGAPAWACDGNGDGQRPSRFHSASRSENGYRDDGDRPERFRSASNDRPGEGRSHYDREHHDNPAL